MESNHPIPKLKFVNGELSLLTKPKNKRKLTINEVIWSNSLKLLENAAKKGVCNFITVLNQRKPLLGDIKLYLKTGDTSICHHINGWWFKFEFRSGKFISMY